jgi:outer membrane protein TolC
MTLAKPWIPHNEMAMAEVFAHPRDAAGQRLACSRRRGTGSRHLSRSLRAVLALGLLVLIWGGLDPCTPASAASSALDAKVVPTGKLDFEACVRLALQQSPYLTKSSLEIDIRRLDESDSRYAMVPPVTFRSIYYVNHANQVNQLGESFNAKPYSLSFSTDSYNPVGSYFTLQAQKMATRIAVFAHLEIISHGLERLGKMFLSLAAMQRLAVYQGDLLGLCRENLTYAENLQSIGTGTSLGVRVATQELELAKNEQERLTLSQKRSLTNLKTFLGLKPEQSVDLDLRDARRQVLGSFDPAAATLEQTKNRSYELKALRLKEKMQGYNILLAKAKIFPSLVFTTQTPDPLSGNPNRGLYVGLGLEVPIWDGFKRIRNVSRQKAVLKQFNVEKDLKENDLTDKWNGLQQDLQSAAGALKLARSQEELARLKERQSEIRYHSGTQPLPAWLEGRKANLEAQKNVTAKRLEYAQIILELRQFSGDLGYSYVDQNSWKN